MTIDRTGGVVLASGGLDSTTLAYHLEAAGVEVSLLFIDYGQHCAATEYRRLTEALPRARFGEPLVVKLGGVFQRSESRLIRAADLWTESVSKEDMYLPYRNLLLLSVAAAHAKTVRFSSVYSGFINSNHAEEIDCSAQFFRELNGLLGEYGGVSIEMPFRDWTKTDVARRAIELGVPIGSTYSCQIGASVPCGACPNCVDRLSALAEAAP